MKNTLIVASIIAVLGGGFLFVSSGDDSGTDQNQASQNNATNDQPAAEVNIEDDLFTYVDKNSEPYIGMSENLSGSAFDEFFIANMIHFSEGEQQLEERAAKSGDVFLSKGATARAAYAKANVEMYKKIQKEMGLPASYGDSMQYHGAMGADSSVYYALTSIDGLDGEAYLTELRGQLVEFRTNQTLAAGVGIVNASDSKVTELSKETLAYNKPLLDVLNER